MKLHTDIATNAKGLHRARRRRPQLGALRQETVIEMELEPWTGGDTRIVVRLHVEPADLRFVRPLDDATVIQVQCLGAEADAEDRDIASLRLGDEVKLASEPRLLDLLVVDGALGAENHEDVVPV